MYGDPVTIEGTELLARCIQHETDHLDGILFIDRMDPAQRKLAMKAIREAEWWGDPIPQVRVSPHETLGRASARLMRLVFAGTPQTAVPALDALLASRHEVVAVVTRPDAPGRAAAGKVEASPVARRAAEAGLEVLTPARPRDPEFLERLREIGPDCCPMVAYGALLPQSALDIPAHGWVNLHFSVLPAWRGAAPVQHAILHGDDVTGATTFQRRRRAGRGPGLRGADRAGPARLTPAATCWNAWPTPARSCSSPRWTGSRPGR